MRINFFYLLLFLLFFFTKHTYAHVGYVVPKEEFNNLKGLDTNFLLKALSDPVNILIIIATPLFLFFLYYLLARVNLVKHALRRIVLRANNYKTLVSWIIRLALGIALIGAGISHSFITPFITANELISKVQIITGFLLLSGFLLTPAILLSIFLFIFALIKNPYIIGNFDFLALSVSFLILSNSRPGVDDLIGIPNIKLPSKLKNYVSLIIRIGVGVSMAYLALFEKILNPHLSGKVVEMYNLTKIIPVSESMWVFSTGFIELFIAILLLVGYKTRFVSVITIFVLSLSFFYFKEDVYSHVTLFSSLALLFILGSGKISLDNFLKK